MRGFGCECESEAMLKAVFDCLTSTWTEIAKWGTFNAFIKKMFRNIQIPSSVLARSSLSSFFIFRAPQLKWIKSEQPRRCQIDHELLCLGETVSGNRFSASSFAFSTAEWNLDEAIGSVLTSLSAASFQFFNSALRLYASHRAWWFKAESFNFIRGKCH